MATLEKQQMSGGERADTVTERAGEPNSYEDRVISDIPILEWIIGAVGLVIVAGVIVFLFYHALTESRTAPDVNVSVVSVVRVRSGYLVTIKALNHGGSTAADVGIEAELRRGADVVERSHATLGYSPPGSEQQAGLFFTQDPRQFDLRVRALGYVKP